MIVVEFFGLQWISKCEFHVIIKERPELHNAFNENIIEEITRVFREVATGVNNTGSTYSGTRVVVFTGSGPSFSAGKVCLLWVS